jgi:hypothetical protein
MERATVAHLKLVPVHGENLPHVAESSVGGYESARRVQPELHHLGGERKRGGNDESEHSVNFEQTKCSQ